MDRLYDSQPYLTNWTETIKKLKKEGATGWEGGVGGWGVVLSRRRAEGQGKEAGGGGSVLSL